MESDDSSESDFANGSAKKKKSKSGKRRKSNEYDEPRASSRAGNGGPIYDDGFDVNNLSGSDEDAPMISYSEGEFFFWE